MDANKIKEYTNHYMTHKNAEFLSDMSEKERLTVLKDIYKAYCESDGVLFQTDSSCSESNETEEDLLLSLLEGAECYFTENPEYYEFLGDVNNDVCGEHAFHYWELAIEHYEAVKGKDCIEKASVLEKMACELYHYPFENYRRSALELFQDVVDIRLANDDIGPYLKDDYMAMHKIMCSYFQDGYDNCYLRKAVELDEKFVNSSMWDLIGELEDLKEKYMDLGEYKKAQECLRVEFPIAEKLYKEDDVRFVCLHRDLGVTYLYLGNLAEALNSFMDAEQICAPLFEGMMNGNGITDMRIQLKVVKEYTGLLRDMAVCFHNMGNEESSNFYSEKSEKVDDDFKTKYNLISD